MGTADVPWIAIDDLPLSDDLRFYQTDGVVGLTELNVDEIIVGGRKEEVEL